MMLKSLIFLLRFVLFWLIFFFIERLIFLIFFSEKLIKIPFKEISQSFFYGLRMDASMTGYISAIPLLIFLILWVFPGLKLKSAIFKGYIYTLIAIFSLLSVISLNIYREWGSKINARAIDLFFHSPNEAIASGASSPIFVSLLIWIAVAGASIVLAKNLIPAEISAGYIPLWQKIVAGIFLIGLNFLAIRGGIDASPMNQSMAYYSNKPILNHAAINTEWNLVKDLVGVDHRRNPYTYFSTREAFSIVRELYAPLQEQDTTRIFSITKPNVVFIIIESFTADVIESLGGEKGVAPQFEQLISEGLFFDHIYASGDRTDKGLIAILSAFPSQATQSIIKLNDKQEKLPAISQELKKNGYHTVFHYGGQSEFFNIKSYLLSHGFDKLVDKSDFKNADLSAWGVYDHEVFKRNIADLDKQQEPFFSTVLSLSNHEPFQLPGSPKFAGTEPENRFRSTAYYTDSSIAGYLKEARTKPWFTNTVFILVADHGHRLPKNKYENYDPARFRIPLLIYGGALKPEFRGRVVTKTGNQTDIAATLLNQLGFSHNEFKWSSNLLNNSKPGFGFFCWDNGFGFAAKDQTLSFDNVSKKIIYRQNPQNIQSDTTLLRYGKAYMQHVYQAFLEY